MNDLQALKCMNEQAERDVRLDGCLSVVAPSPSCTNLWLQSVPMHLLCGVKLLSSGFLASPQRPLYCDTFTLNLIIFRRPTIVCLIGRVGDARVCLFCIFPDSVRLGKWNIFLLVWIFSPYLFFFFFSFLFHFSNGVYYAKKNARIPAMHTLDNLILVL